MQDPQARELTWGQNPRFSGRTYAECLSCGPHLGMWDLTHPIHRFPSSCCGSSFTSFVVKDLLWQALVFSSVVVPQVVVTLMCSWKVGSGLSAPPCWLGFSSAVSK